MYWFDPDNASYNRFVNLDGIEDKILFYLLSEQDKNESQKKLVHELWRLMYYNDEGCLLDDAEHPLPTYNQIIKMIDNNGREQMDSRFFRYPYIEDTVTQECSQIRVYVDSVVPTNHLVSTVGVGIEVITHNKLVNVINNLYDEDEEYNNPTEEHPIITYKNRLTILLKDVLALLNGADVAGVGKLQFSAESNPYSQALVGKWNHRNFFGYKMILSCGMSGAM